MICDPKCPYRFHRRCVAAGKDVFDMQRCPKMKTIMRVEETNEYGIATIHTEPELRKGQPRLPGCD